MSKPTTACHVSNCLGHADERTAEVVCLRCRGRRWILLRPASALTPTEYTCCRCRAVRAGRNVADPIVAHPTEAQQAARWRSADRLRALKSTGKKAPIPLGGAP